MNVVKNLFLWLYRSEVASTDNITCVIFDVIGIDEQDESQVRIVGAASTDRLEKGSIEQTPASLAEEHFAKTKANYITEKMQSKTKKTPNLPGKIKEVAKKL